MKSVRGAGRARPEPEADSMKKTGKSGLGHLKKLEKRDREIHARKARIEMTENIRSEKKSRRHFD